MTIAVAVFENEISPRFDCCAELAFLTESDVFLSAERVRLEKKDGESRIRMVLERSCRVLLCGGIRKQDLFSLTEAGVMVVDGLSGPVQDRIRAFREKDEMELLKKP